MEHEESIPEVKKGVIHSDQLKIQTTIQRLIERCLRLKNTMGLQDSVEALRSALYYDIPGLPFQTLIDKREAGLEIEQQTRLKAFIQQNRPMWAKADDNITLDNIGRVPRVMYRLKGDHWYYTQMLEFLISMTAEYEMWLHGKAVNPQGVEGTTDIDRKAFPKKIQTKDNISVESEENHENQNL